LPRRRGPLGYEPGWPREGRFEGGLQSVLRRAGKIGVMPSNAFAVFDQPSRGQPGIHNSGVLATDQSAERRAKHPLRVNRLKDDTAEGVLQLINIHGNEHYAIGAWSEATKVRIAPGHMNARSAEKR
jgi:hypothetical protein